jgi:hypothetical protein
MRFFARVQTCACSVFALLFLLVAAGNTPAQQQWGTVKGQIVFDGDKVPLRVAMDVTKDKADCLAKKKELLSEEWVVDPKTKGIKWVCVWLIPGNAKEDADIVKPIPVHPMLVKEKLPDLVVDQPCCMFEPYVIAMQEGQKLVVKNSMTISHNVKIDGSPKYENPSLNQLVPGPGKLDPVGPFHAQPHPIPIACNIHPWMTGYIRVFSHPYFCLTEDEGKFEFKNAPAGNYRLVVWHPGANYIVGEKKLGMKFGTPIEIKANDTTDLGKIKAAMPKKD